MIQHSDWTVGTIAYQPVIITRSPELCTVNSSFKIHNRHQKWRLMILTKHVNQAICNLHSFAIYIIIICHFDGLSMVVSPDLAVRIFNTQFIMQAFLEVADPPIARTCFQHLIPESQIRWTWVCLKIGHPQIHRLLSSFIQFPNSNGISVGDIPH